MSGKLTGRCMCANVRYEIKSPPISVYYCHCNDCKKSTGSAFHVGLVLHVDDVEIKAGNLKNYTKQADSGNQMTRSFCGDCGSPLFTRDSGAPENIIIKAGSLDEPERVTPIAQLWTIHAVSWAKISDDIRSFEKGKAFEL